MNAKRLFLKEKDLAPYWASIANDTKFEHVLMFARAEFLESQPTQDETRGAERFINIIESLSENAETGAQFPSPGLHHIVEKLPEKPNTET